MVQFKNHDQSEFTFSPKLNAMVGPNGSGKTTVLDAIHVLCMTKSYFHSTDSLNIQFDKVFFVLQGSFESKDGTVPVYCGLQRGEKKVFKVDGAVYERLSEHMGRFPVVMISPADRNLLTDGSEVRRKFMDQTIAQSDSAFLHALIRYNRALSQRNSLLKYFAANRTFEADSLALYDDQLCEYAPAIHQARERFVEAFIPMLKHNYAQIAGEREAVGLRYRSRLNEVSMRDLLAESLAKDRLLQYSTAGPHREDLLFELHGRSLRQVGSQGQQKSYLVALKLATFDSLTQNLGAKPILLLDDVFDKLDAERVEGLIRLVNDDHFGQIFLSDTHRDRTELLLQSVDADAKVFEL